MAQSKKKKSVKKVSSTKAKKPAAKKAVTKKAPKKAAPKKAAPKKAAPKKVLTKKAAPQKAAKETKKQTINWQQFLTPLDDRLIVEVGGNERTTPSGLLFIPDTVADSSGNARGKVLVVGRGHREKNGRIRPMDVKAGDTVVFTNFSGSKIKIDDKELTILRESEVLGIVGK